MIDLSRHIELLLLDHDCVIVPELGAFIANNASACYNEVDDSMFLPPYRNICFNQHLVSNDGLLVQAYMNAYDAAYPDALKQMKQEISHIIDELDLKGVYVLNNIGTLHKGINGNITFTSLNAGILTPALYGLYSFCAKSWEEVLKEKQLRNTLNETLVVPIQAKTSIETERRDKNNKKRNKFVDIAVAAVASVLLFFLFSYPAFRSSSINDSNRIFVASSPIMSSEINVIEEETTENNVITQLIGNTFESNKEINIHNKIDVVKSSKVVNEKNYVIVLATCVSKKNAMQLIENLKNDGYYDVIFDESGRMNRVTFSSFHSFKEASKELIQLKELSPYFKEAWVYNTKK